MIKNYYELVMAFVEIGTFLIWVVFAQLFFLTFKRQRRARFIIHTEGYDCSSMKLAFTNMAAEPVYVRNVFFSIDCGENKKVYNLDDLHGEGLFKKEVDGSDKWEYQGTILPGNCVKLEVGGIFYPCLSKKEEETQQDVIQIEPGDIVNIFVVFFHGADKRLLGASRHFKFFKSSAGDFFNPLSWNTTSWSTVHERKKLMRTLKQEREDYPGFS
ncbi:hypothetical protein CXF87_17875 [Halomonas sp. MES3-P3E]|nr:hypothetical protein CXF87_17875 [Halomonas sp. MES3-P3E]